MNVGKSIKMALLKGDKDQAWLAAELGLSLRQVNKVANKPSANTDTIEKIAKSLGMKSSDFIALGED